jgi:Tol biopolymer transport system component
LMNASTLRDELGENNAQKLVQLGDDLNKIDQDLFKEKSEEILKQIKNMPAETTIQKAETILPLNNPPVSNNASQTNNTGEKTVFVSERDGNPEIYSMNSDGTSQTRLTSNEVYDIMPAWSPDCSKIVFVSERDNNPEIYSMNADGSNQTRLTVNSAYDYSPNWSPDGTKIAFVSNRGISQNTTSTVNKINYKIFVMNADGSDQVLLTDNSIDDESPKWSPDGKKLAFVSTRDGNPEIYLINADGTNLIRLTNNQTYDLMPAWSPDGSKLAFRSDRDGNPEIYSMNADGTNQTRLTDNSVADESPSWSPDGTKIAFVSKRDNVIDETGIIVSEIYIMNADGYNINRLTNNNFEDYFPNWSKISLKN